MPADTSRPTRDTIAPLVRPAPTVPSDATVLDAAQAMVENGVDAVLVTGPDGPERLLTERDLVALVAAGCDAGSTTVPHVSDPLAVPVTAAVEAVAALMLDTGTSHVVVHGIDRRTLGVVSLRDVAEALLR